MSSSKASIVIPCYWSNEDSLRMTERCIRTLFDSDFSGELFVVNDCSPYTAQMTLPTQWNKVDLPENKGFSGAVNEGLRRAKGDYLIVSNNDIEFIQPDWYEHLIEPLKRGYGISSIRTTEPDGWTTENKITDNDKFGSFWCITRKAYDKLKVKDDLLDTYFGRAYGEDLDLWHRARDAGVKIAKNHAGIVYHKGKATLSALDGEGDANFQKFPALYKRKWGDKAHLILTPQNTIALYTEPELRDMGDKAKPYYDREVTVEQVNQMFGANW